MHKRLANPLARQGTSDAEFTSCLWSLSSLGVTLESLVQTARLQAQSFAWDVCEIQQTTIGELSSAWMPNIASDGFMSIQAFEDERTAGLIRFTRLWLPSLSHHTLATNLDLSRDATPQGSCCKQVQEELFPNDSVEKGCFKDWIQLHDCHFIKAWLHQSSNLCEQYNIWTVVSL